MDDQKTPVKDAVGVKTRGAQLRRSYSARAFTLIEITFAILILASSLVVLLGLQGSSIQRAIHDQNVRQAMLLARQLLATIEIRTDPQDVMPVEGSVDEVMKDLLNGAPLPPEALDPDQRFRADVTTSTIQVPVGIGDPEQMRRISVVVSWSNASADQLAVDYFVPMKP